MRSLIATVERDLGRKLEWAAVNHYGTARPHAHLVVRGVAREGLEVRLDGGYISQGLRWRAQELATEELGPPLAVDVRRALDKEITQNRFTSLDLEIERCAAVDISPKVGPSHGTSGPDWRVGEASATCGQETGHLVRGVTRGGTVCDRTAL